MSIAKRTRLYHLRRRVPRRYRGVEPRETVWISLHTDSETIARSKADRAWSQMIEAWEERVAGNSKDAEARYEAARPRPETGSPRDRPCRPRHGS